MLPMQWDADRCVWLNTSKLNLKVKTVKTGEPTVEFDDSNREVRLTVHKKFPKTPDIIVRVNTRHIDDFKQEWCLGDSSREIFVLPCNELYEHREYEENIFDVNIGSFEQTLSIPAKTEVLNIQFSSLSLERSLLGVLTLILTGIGFESEFITNNVQEFRLLIDREETLSFLEEIGTGNKIENSQVSSNLGLKFSEELDFKHIELNLQYVGGIEQANGLDQLNSSKESSKYFCATFYNGELSSRSVLVKQKSFTLPLGNNLGLTIYSIVVRNNEEPSLFRYLYGRSTREKIPLHPAIIDNFASDQKSTFLPFHTSDRYTFIIFWQNSHPPRIPKEIRLEIKVSSTTIYFDIPSLNTNSNSDSTMIIIPKKIYYAGVEYTISLSNVVFSYPKTQGKPSNVDYRSHDRFVTKSLSSKASGVNSDLIEEIVNRFATKPFRRGEPALLMTLGHNEHYYVGGHEERYWRKEGMVFFDHQSSTTPYMTDIHIICSNVQKLE